MALIEMSHPYIVIDSVEKVSDSKTKITWKVNGCYIINEAKAVIKGGQINQLNSTKGYCNYKIEGNEEQTIFHTVLDSYADV